MEAYAPLNNFFETSIFVGSRYQPIKFVVDTGSSWTWIAYDYCESETTGRGYEPIALSKEVDSQDSPDFDDAEEFLKQLLSAFDSEQDSYESKLQNSH